MLCILTFILNELGKRNSEQFPIKGELIQFWVEFERKHCKKKTTEVHKEIDIKEWLRFYVLWRNPTERKRKRREKRKQKGSRSTVLFGPKFICLFVVSHSDFFSYGYTCFFFAVLILWQYSVSIWFCRMGCDTTMSQVTMK